MQNKLSLYFNCKLTNKKLLTDGVSHGYFYPVIYPRDPLAKILSPYEILIETIKTYSCLDFNCVIFNIEIDDVTDFQKKEIAEIIDRQYTAVTVRLNFSRPFDRSSWRNDISSAIELIGENSPVFVAMNHDHPYIDYSSNALQRVVDYVFAGDNFGKAFYYSHAPEVISLAFNGIKYGRFQPSNSGVCESIPVDGWLDSYCVMTLKTLDHVFSKLEYSGEYIGRIDWPGATFRKLQLKTYTFPREFCRHYDGYGHVTGLRLISETSSLLEDRLPRDKPDSSLVYYQRWLDAFILLIRDALRDKIFVTKGNFIEEIERSLFYFKLGYLDQDMLDGILSDRDCVVIQSELRNAIYFNANNLFFLVRDDIFLLNASKPFNFRKLISYRFFPFFRKIKSFLTT